MSDDRPLRHTWQKVPRIYAPPHTTLCICRDCGLFREHPWWARYVCYFRGLTYIGQRAPVCPDGRLYRGRT